MPSVERVTAKTSGADEKMPEVVAAADQDDASAPKWKTGDKVFAVWAGNGCYYGATVVTADHSKRMVHVDWDDKEDTHRVVPFDKVMEPSDESSAWSGKRIDQKASVREVPDKGRCLFTNEVSEPGQVVFVERPLLVALPASQPKLWEHLQKLHQVQPLNLGTVTFHYAAILSMLVLDASDCGVILDKFVPDEDEEPGEDVLRILASIKEDMKGVLELNAEQKDPKKVQRLVSAWRYNSFGHHKEDGLVLYNRISMCAHSCDPSCCWSYGEEDSFVIRSRIALRKGDELTISYLQDDDLLKGTPTRQAKLQNWRFTCMCTRCCLTLDIGRGFKCRRCRIGVMYATTASGSPALQGCHVCTAPPSPEDQQMLLQLEEEYVARVEALDKTDVADVEIVYQASLDIFERHWILYVMDTMLWEARREKALVDALEHQRRRIEFHEHYYPRPTFILAWCHEELGDSLVNLHPERKWHCAQEFTRAYHMLLVLCGSSHQYTTSPYHKLWQVQNGSAASVQTANTVSDNQAAMGASANRTATAATPST